MECCHIHIYDRIVTMRFYAVVRLRSCANTPGFHKASAQSASNTKPLRMHRRMHCQAKVGRTSSTCATWWTRQRGGFAKLVRLSTWTRTGPHGPRGNGPYLFSWFLSGSITNTSVVFSRPPGAAGMDADHGEPQVGKPDE